jgi:hypothetical protein
MIVKQELRVNKPPLGQLLPGKPIQGDPLAEPGAGNSYCTRKSGGATLGTNAFNHRVFVQRDAA